MKRATNLSIDAELLDEAKAIGLNLSATFEAGLREAVRAAKGQRWLNENQEALLSSNAFVEKHGLPLARHRQF
jgi:antitoxin CcdA